MIGGPALTGCGHRVVKRVVMLSNHKTPLKIKEPKPPRSEGSSASSPCFAAYSLRSSAATDGRPQPRLRPPYLRLPLPPARSS